MEEEIQKEGGSNKKLFWIIGIIILVILVGGYFMFFYKAGEEGGLGTLKPFSGDVEKITLAAYEGDTGLLPYIAEEQGFFKENNLNVEIKNYEAGKLAADALIAGEADLSTSADVVLVGNSFEHEDLRVLSTVAIAESLGLVARKDRAIIKSRDLIGKKIGVTKKSTGEYDLGVFLTLNGISIDDIEIVDLKPSEIVKSVVSGEIDAGFTWEPNLYSAKNQLGDNAIILKANIPPFNFVLLSKKEWLDNNPDVAKRFIKALMQAEGFIKEHEQEAKQFMKKRFNYEQDYTNSAWQDHDFFVQLPQALLIKFENIALWRIENNLSQGDMPNYLDYIYFDALEEIKPDAVRIMR